MASLLFFYPRNIKNTPAEVPLLALRDRGHHIRLLTIDPPGGLHTYYQQIGLEAGSLYDYDTRARGAGMLRHLAVARAMGRAARTLKPDVVWAHLQEANFPMMLAKTLGWIRQPVVPFRHSGSAYHLARPPLPTRKPRNEHLQDWFIQRTAPLITVPGEGIRRMLVEQEGVPAHKVQIIPYAYDVERMQHSVDPAEVAALRARYPGKVLLIAIMRFVRMKRHFLLVELMQQLHADGLDAQLVLLDEGYLLDEVKAQVAVAGLTDRIHFVGRQPNVLAWLAAADLVLHPSLTDASNSVVKEAGLVGTPASAVTGVGDFDDYLLHGQNGFLFTADGWQAGTRQIVQQIATATLPYREIGRAAGAAVRQRFVMSTERIVQYEALLYTAP